MENKKSWGSSRVIFFSLKEEIEQDLLKAFPKRTIWQKHHSILNCSYANFVQLCNKYIGQTLIIFTSSSSKKIKTEEKMILEPVELISKSKSARPVFKGKKIHFTPTPNPEDVKRWLGNKD
ncbi:hypothetical protein [Commensalibacter nepenthis]|uniref:Uncharacterized protein n=1 Tax=Commensalibacter nepenthis TaxID=3043872 RepID=A0ABT6QAX1_9PROT|nr:hypothetical protein [Commensalibacter sp. TBRC 10068]MDI2113902.1 hypothetical protein [Commensalibacter sp. TBRC 10068]